MLSMPTSSAAHQEQSVVFRDSTLTAKLQAGISHVKAERPDSAVVPLREVVDVQPAYRVSNSAPAAYWLGRAYNALGEANNALDAWAAGIQALREADQFSVRLAETFVDHVFDEKATRHYALGREVYLYLLERLDKSPDSVEHSALLQHVRALAPLLPPSVRQRIGIADEGQPDSLALAPEAGAHLRAWWRSQDPMPATQANERLEEHLERVAHARRHYQKGDSLDDRGRTYIRLGAPYKQTTIDFNSSTFRRKVLDRNPTLPSHGFSDNEFWVYRRSEPSAHFLFIEEESDYYTLGTSHDLIPRTLKNGLSQSPRGQRLSRAYVRAMAEAYRQLALYHENFSTRYMTLANYADLLDRAEIPGQRPNFDSAPPAFAQMMRSRIDSEDRYTERLREEQVSRSYSNLIGAVDVLPVSVRTARFLDEDGRTRTQVYWSMPLSGLVPSDDLMERMRLDELPEGYYITASVRQLTSDYRTRSTNRHRAVVDHADSTPMGILEPKTYTVRGDTGLYHLSVQWDAYATKGGADLGSIQLGRRLKFTAQRHDSLTALRSDPSRLEMSDLKPLLLTDTDEPLARQLEEAPAYPFAEVTPEAPLALYFEVYHLSFNDRGRAEYTVEYDVKRRTKREGLASLFRGDEEQRTATRTTHEADSRTVQEHIVLDLSEFEDPTGDLTVTVRITDEATGRDVERSIDFEVVRRP